jgi:hypothetical protein|tara:strand:+ start:591 stop:938 length:348 start_codon:yes stop_codon:yes gene_type:complete
MNKNYRSSNQNRRGPGNQLPIKHNQKKPFEPGKYGKNWGGIDFELAHGVVAVPPAKQPIIGYLKIAGQRIGITFSEANKIAETLNDAKHQFNVARSLGMTAGGYGEGALSYGSGI